MQKPVVITTDSSADLPPYVLEQYGIHIIRMYINVEGRTGRDGVEIQPMDIYDAFTERGALPKTAAPSIVEYKEFFEQFTKQGAAVVHIGLNHKFSSVIHVATLAAQEAEGEVYVVDSYQFCVGMGIMAVKAAQWRDEGLPATEIAAKVETERAKVLSLYYMDNMKFLSKSGRCPRVVAMCATLLDLHPLLSISGVTGEVVVGKKFRGKNAKEDWLRHVTAKFNEQCDPSLSFFMHSPEIPPGVYEPMNRAAKSMMPDFAGMVQDGTGCSVISHVGGGCYAMIAMMR